MTGALTADPYLWQRGGVDAAAIGPGGTPARKSTGSRKICGIKVTAALPQRETGVQTLAYPRVFADTEINGIVAFGPQDCCCERKTFDWK
jgi:hypothetical protein